MRRFFTLFTVLIFSGILASAQNRTISGQVRDLQGNPVGFATVEEKGTTNRVTTDATGNFSIKVKQAAANLTVTSAGYDKQEIPATGSSVAVALVRNTQELTAVVVTSLGAVRQKASLGYATTTVKAKELTQATPVNLQSGLIGKVSGLNVTTTNSGVRGTTRLTLRGIRSLTGSNQPMLILDGIPLDLSYINSINPNDIVDINLLKSASATAIYGPDGANGAVVVTTKRGSRKPVLTFSQTTQLEKIAYMPKFQDQFGGGYNQDPITGDGTFTAYEQQSWGTRFDGSTRQFGQTGPNGEKLIMPYSYNPRGRINFFNTGVTNQTDASYAAEGFYLSAQNVHISGTLPHDINRRRSITLRAEKEYNKFKAILTVRYTNDKYDVTTNNTNVYYGVTGSPGNYDLSAFKNWKTDYFSSPDGYYTTYLDNRDKTPYYAIDNHRESGKVDDIFGNLELNYKLTNWLNFVYRLGANVTSSSARQTTLPFQRSAYALTLTDPAALDITAQIQDVNVSGKADILSGATPTVAFNDGNRVSQEFFANFNTKVKNIGINGTLGGSLRTSIGKATGVGSQNLGFSDFQSPAVRQGEPNIIVANFQTKLRRYFGRLGLDYKNMIFLEGTGSYDTDSRLAPVGNTFSNSDISFFYPGVNASLVISKMIPGLEENKYINYIKLRGAVTKTGNASAWGRYANDVNFGVANFFPYGSTLGYQIGGTVYPKKLKPEFIKNKEIGLELGFLKNRISFEANYYSQDNSNQVLDVQLSNTTGFTTAKLNAAEFTNKGLELDLKLTPLVKIGQLSVDFKINYAHQTNEVTKLIDGVDRLGIGNYNYAIVGRSAFTFLLPDYLRDRTPGSPTYGKVIVDRTTGMPTIDPNIQEYGHTLPDDIVGLNLNLTFKGFTFGVTAEYRTGNQIVADQLGQYLDDNGISQRSAANGRRAFVFPNSVYDDGSGKLVENTGVYTKNYGRLFYNTSANTDAISNYVASGAFWKLREVALSYTMPARFFKGNTIKGVTFAITGRNLLTWLPKSNVWTDPEFTSNGNNAYTGNAGGRSTGYNLPPTRIFGANVVFTF
ncbi:MAG: SusC/RagA family TonB-linked outer membrane protein [Ferruginibacter sp.]